MTKPAFRSAAMVAIAAAMATAPVAALAQTAPMQPMMMQMMPQPTTLSLDATGEVSATPDKATINFSVVTQAGTASDAMKNNNIKMNNVLAALKAAGIADKDIQTSSLNLAPQYDYSNGNTTPRITGYQAQNQVTVRINDLNRTGPVVDAVIKAGVNQVDSISFGLKNDDALLDQARQQAVQTLTQRANLYAAATGMHVKRLLTLSEGSPAYPGPRPMAMEARAFAAKDVSTPVAAGEMQLSVQVSATFELEK